MAVTRSVIRSEKEGGEEERTERKRREKERVG